MKEKEKKSKVLFLVMTNKLSKSKGVEGKNKEKAKEPAKPRKDTTCDVLYKSPVHSTKFLLIERLRFKTIVQVFIPSWSLSIMLVPCTDLTHVVNGIEICHACRGFS